MTIAEAIRLVLSMVESAYARTDDDGRPKMNRDERIAVKKVLGLQMWYEGDATDPTWQQQLDRLPGWTRKDLRQLQDKIRDSRVFMGLVADGGKYFDDTRCVLQMGYALMHDKPIYLMVQRDTPVPAALRKAAAGIIEFKGPDDYGEATSRLAEILAGLPDEDASPPDKDASPPAAGP
jgi:hypothetical protein